MKRTLDYSAVQPQLPLALACALVALLWLPTLAGEAKVPDVAELVASRLALMPDVAKVKWNAGRPVEDLAREADVFAATTDAALAVGLDREYAERVVRAQIEASKHVQRTLFVSWRNDERGSWVEVPDLDADLRPRISALTAALLRALAQFDCEAWQSAKPPDRPSVDGTAWHIAWAGLRPDGCLAAG